ncbi:glycosyltransferase family 2 protein [Nitrosomonas sp. Nm132]|jgi:glycosyltransferase involved in cell wall biosynthesis|uniref:glycosyltransferase family 2 protein n=1 Tax=Nitrosomonas sp. Nm132 TaxID=1881053 RepID=UPI000886349E|nr:glycosyltransferase [Nitrosomonas sp. Nm132]SDH18366.1 Glycosyl transferase family 2 [Nitrosomonas sp. Nm132]
MKIGIVLAYHNFVNKFILPCLNSIVDHIKCEKFVCVFDNESSHKDNFKVADFCNARNDFRYIRIDDQNKNGGLTGAWNKGVDLCIQNDCEIIFIMNDDILINETWEHFVSSLIADDVIYGPITNNPGHAWVNKSRRWTFNHLFHQSEKKQYSHDGRSRNENPIKVGFVNGFCFGCTAKTFINNRYDDKHYFNPAFPFEGNETEFQIRLFNLKPTNDNQQNKRILNSLSAHDRAIVVPRCYVDHYKNHAWRTQGGGRYAKEQFT